MCQFNTYTLYNDYHNQVNTSETGSKTEFGYGQWCIPSFPEDV